MKMPKSNCEALDNNNISPIRSKTKHTSTPLRTRRKTSRRDQGLDVHTVSTSTPTAAHRSPRLQRPRQDSPQLLNSGFNSPSSSFPCSQDGRPDVVWDFTSPKLPKGSRKRELKMTVQELLDNLNQCQAVECDSKSNPHIKLLENWMSKQPADVAAVKEIKNQRKDVKKRSRHRVEELKKFIESIQKSKNDNTSPSHSKSPSEGNKNAGELPLEQNTSFKNSFIDGGKSDDSSEELWGDVDNSFIVKATQELEKVNVGPTATSNHAEEIISTIPETIPNLSAPKSSSSASEPRKRSCEEHADILLHLSNIDWDVDGDDEWDNGFLLEDDDLSLIPDNVLSGEASSNRKEISSNDGHSLGNIKEISSTDGHSLGNRKEMSSSDSHSRGKRKIISNNDGHSLGNRKEKSSNDGHLLGNRKEISSNDGYSLGNRKEISNNDGQSLDIRKETSSNGGHSLGNNRASLPVASNGGQANVVSTVTESDLWLEEIELDVNCVNVPNNELYNSFDDGSFEEESLLCQPEVLSRLDEVESMLSQPKCTPEEIKKKKDEALKRRKKTQLKRKN